jgi:hypothetical protein
MRGEFFLNWVVEIVKQIAIRLAADAPTAAYPMSRQCILVNPTPDGENGNLPIGYSGCHQGHGFRFAFRLHGASLQSRHTTAV